jgi:hypothetical protein
VRGRDCAMLAVLLLCACQRGRDEAVERVVEHAIAAHGRESKVTIDREHGSISVDLGPALRPSGWPTDVPMYPRASRAKIEASADQGQRLAITTDDSPADVGAFYRDELRRLGWHVEEGGAGALRASRGAARLDLQVSLRPERRETRASIEYTAGGRG